MSKGYVEIDFFQMEKRNHNASSKQSSPECVPSSFRGIQNVVSRINPQLLKTVIAAEAAAGRARSTSDNIAATTSTNLSSPSRTPSHAPLPLHNSASRRSIPPAADTDTTPLTIFYNGTVTTFHVPGDKAEAIMRMAEGLEDCRLDSSHIKGDLPIARRKSLQRFLEKRKERLMSASPYHRLGPSCLCWATWCGQTWQGP